MRLIQELFSKEDLRQLCYELGVQYDDLSGDGNAAKALSLVEAAERQTAVPTLVEAAAKVRPLAAWDAALTPAAAAQSLTPAPALSPAPSLPRSPALLPAPPRHGFWGRSRELLLLERAFRRSPAVVLHGFGGLGKTALAVEAGRWFTRTGRFPGGAAFVSFEQGGSLAQLCSWAGQTLSGDPDWVIHGDGSLPERLAALLAAQPCLLILDNFESVLGRDPLMPPEELQELLDFVGEAFSLSGQAERAPASRILITTRDTTFNDARFAPSKWCRHIALGGLAEHDALALAAAVLDAHAIDRAAIPRQALVDLMAHLGGHPLSLNLALPRLGQYSPAELTARFEELLPGFIEGKAQERNESLAVSLEFSLRRLGEATRAALPDLAVFVGATMETNALQITEMDAALWRTARSELEQAALVTVENVPGVSPPFLHFHPTLLPYLATRLSDERRQALQTRYWQFYYGLATFLYQSDTQTPHQARAIALREMPNLRRALELALAAGALEAAVDFANSIAHFLDVFGRWREREGMMRRVSEKWAVKSEKLEESGEGVTQAEFMLLSRQGEALRQQGRAAEAERLLRGLLARLTAGAAYDATYDMAMTQMSIGRCLADQGRPSQAIPFQEQAIKGFAALSENNKGAKEMLGKVYSDLADNLAATGEFDEAQKTYEVSLEIKREVDDQRAIGVTLGQLGTLALRRGDLKTARERYMTALETFRRLGEPQSEAAIWHQLGRAAEEGRQWAEAERCYRESLQIKEAHRDWPGVARTCNQLASVAQKDGRFADAERWYLRAIELGEQLRYDAESGKWLSNLANLYLSQKRLAEAEQFARRALAIKETLDLSAEPWKTYGILAQIAAAQGQPATARDWRRKEQESYAAYAGAAHKLPSWAPNFINNVAVAAQGVQEAQEAVTHILPQLENSGWTNMTTAVKRLLAGEQDMDALFANLDREDAYIIRAILQQLAGEAQTPGVSETPGVSAAAPAQEAAPT